MGYERFADPVERGSFRQFAHHDRIIWSILRGVPRRFVPILRHTRPDLPGMTCFDQPYARGVRVRIERDVPARSPDPFGLT